MQRFVAGSSQLLPCSMGYLFDVDIMRKFAYQNNIDLIVHAHKLVMEGFRFIFDCMIVTVSVWSAPNYCYW